MPWATHIHRWQLDGTHAHGAAERTWSVPCQVRAAIGKPWHNHERRWVAASRTRRGQLAYAVGNSHAMGLVLTGHVDIVECATPSSGSKPGLKPELSPAQPEPPTRAWLHVFVSPSPTKLSPSRGF